MTLRLAPLALAALVAFGFAHPCSAADISWPVFHGPDGSNKSPDTGLLAQWPEDGPKMVWQSEGLGDGYSSVSVANGMIYTSGNIDGKTIVTALDMDGKSLWTAENGDAWTKDFPGTRGTPTIDGDRLYHESPIGNLICMNAGTGQKIWSLNILEEFDGENIRWALSESPIIDGDRVICCPFGSKASVVALDKMTGEVVWAAESTGDRAGYGTPTLAEYQGIRMVLTMNQKAVVGVDAETGKLLFRHPHETKYDVNVLIPLFHDGHVFVSSGYGSGSQMLQLSVEGDDVSAEQIWKNEDLDNHHGGVVLLEGHIYGTNYKSRWVCVDWKTGETKWVERGIGKGSLTYADGKLYGYGENRAVALIDPSPAGYREISQFDIPRGGEGKSWAHPVVIGGRLYLRHGDFLYVYDVAAD